MAAMSTIAMVAALVWGVGWSIFFSAHKDCYCDMARPTFCYCSVPFDLQQVMKHSCDASPLACFACCHWGLELGLRGWVDCLEEVMKR
jgi:hypothetical protein